MRHAQSKQREAELEEQQKQIDHESKWTLPPADDDSQAAPVQFVTGVGFHEIDGGDDEEAEIAGRQGFGSFKRVEAEPAEEAEPSSDDEPERRTKERRQDDAHMKNARQAHSISGSGAAAKPRGTKRPSGEGVAQRKKPRR
ncbi:uncharacterized protein V1510DRAFT_407741 [Dipodascopsis tothii]|uniref:uncharacterized protein n=1 Tax=Dipodascopsis tothii TaxID=44089 RepID=UPI0034CDF2EF